MKPTKTRDKKPLLLRKEKVRDLTGTELGRVVGGGDNGDDDPDCSICSFTTATRRD